MLETQPLIFTAKQLDEMDSEALRNIIVITTDCDDLSVMSLRDIMDGDDWEGASPSEVLEIWLSECSGNSCQIIGVYGSGGWFETYIEHNS